MCDKCENGVIRTPINEDEHLEKPCDCQKKNSGENK